MLSSGDVVWSYPSTMQQQRHAGSSIGGCSVSTLSPVRSCLRRCARRRTSYHTTLQHVVRLQRFLKRASPELSQAHIFYQWRARARARDGRTDEPRTPDWYEAHFSQIRHFFHDAGHLGVEHALGARVTGPRGGMGTWPTCCRPRLLHIALCGNRACGGTPGQQREIFNDLL